MCVIQAAHFSQVLDFYTFHFYLTITLKTYQKCSYNWNSPLWFDVGARSDVILGGEHKLVVKHPLWLVVQHSGGVQLYHLVVLRSQVMARALQVSDLFTARREKRVRQTEQTNTYTTFFGASFISVCNLTLQNHVNFISKLLLLTEKQHDAKTKLFVTRRHFSLHYKY